MASGELLPRPCPSVDSRGGWRAALFLVGNRFSLRAIRTASLASRSRPSPLLDFGCGLFPAAVGLLERVGFYGVQSNLIMYLTGPLGMSTATAAAGVSAWAGTVEVLPLVGALAADSRLGRYRAVVAAGVLNLLSLGMLTVSSALQTPQKVSPSSTTPAWLFSFYVALYLLALGQGFHRPAAQALGADQFAAIDDEPSARASRSSYFNWYHFSISWGYAIAATALSYVQDNVGWTTGFGACWAAMALCLAVFLLGTRTYRAEQPVDGRPFAEAVRAWMAKVFCRKDATDTERLLTPEREEGNKGLVVKLLPIWLTSLVFTAIFSQVTTLFTKQGSTLDRRLGTATGLVVPPAALQLFISGTFITMVPVYDRLLVPLARRVTGRHAGVTTLQRIGAGMAMSGVAMVVAALVEARRLRVARDAGLVDRPDVALPMSLWWIVPQYFLLGVAGVLTEIGLEEFFYDEVPDALRSTGLAFSLSAFGAGYYISSLLVSAIDWATRSNGESWFSDNLNRAHLDYFYWILAGLAAMEVAVFVHFANRFVYRSKSEL
ncbi:hypothetical protein EJB05_18285, partial [Eragrostis curvula]